MKCQTKYGKHGKFLQSTISKSKCQFFRLELAVLLQQGAAALKVGNLRKLNDALSQNRAALSSAEVPVYLSLLRCSLIEGGGSTILLYQ